jgi:signal transduction histidine kinase
MEGIKKFFKQLNFVAQCRKYNLTLWQCPSFLVVITGLITVSVMLLTYFIAAFFSTEPETVALIVAITTSVLMVIDYFIIQGFEQLASASQMKTEFVNIVSHQLRTPLSIIKWSLNLITEKNKQDFNESSLEQLEIIKQSNQRMTDLVNDLLDVARIEQNRLGIRPEKTDLSAVVQELIKGYAALAKASNIKISLEAENNLPLVWIDRQKIKLVLQNLLENAIQYTKGEGAVEIRLKKQNNQKIRCEIKDSGVGIPKEEQGQIFQKFFRSQNIMKYQTEGTGLGLFIAKAIIEASKGKIGFESQEGKGSVFWIEMPINNE